MEKNDLRSIQEQIGYNFKNTDLLQQAFVRSSYAEENGGPDNEILEFIGDKVLDIAVIRYLTERYGSLAEESDDYDSENDWNEFLCDKTEGELTDLKRMLVEKRALASRMDELGLADYLIMGNSDIQNHVECEASVKEDLFEAILGAVAIDSDWDLDSICDAAEIMLNPEDVLSDSEEENYVGLIQDWTESRENRIPLFHYGKGSYESSWYYRFNGISQVILPLTSQNLSKIKYHCLLKISDELPIFRGFGKSKSEARKAVCKLAYEYLKNKDLLWSVKDEIENPNEAEAINQLETLARRGYFALPVYNYSVKYDKNGNPVWYCECHIAELNKCCGSESSSKKAAKKSAAFKMLKTVLE